MVHLQLGEELLIGEEDHVRLGLVLFDRRLHPGEPSFTHHFRRVLDQALCIGFEDGFLLHGREEPGFLPYELLDLGRQVPGQGELLLDLQGAGLCGRHLLRHFLLEGRQFGERQAARRVPAASAAVASAIGVGEADEVRRAFFLLVLLLSLLEPLRFFLVAGSSWDELSLAEEAAAGAESEDVAVRRLVVFLALPFLALRSLFFFLDFLSAVAEDASDSAVLAAWLWDEDVSGAATSISPKWRARAAFLRSSLTAFATAA